MKVVAAEEGKEKSSNEERNSSNEIIVESTQWCSGQKPEHHERIDFRGWHQTAEIYQAARGCA